MTGNDFYQRELDYWRRRALYAEDTLTELQKVLGEANFEDLPPEPPIGTAFYNIDRELIWERKDDGWHCSWNCAVCPEIWAQVVEELPSNARRVLPPLSTLAPGEPEAALPPPERVGSDDH